MSPAFLPRVWSLNGQRLGRSCAREQRCGSSGNGKNLARTQLREEAAAQEERGWLDGPFGHRGSGKASVNGEEKAVSPAFRFGVQRTGKPGAAGELRRSSTNEAAYLHTPTNTPSWDQLFQPCDLYRSRSDNLPLASAKDDRAGRKWPTGGGGGDAPKSRRSVSVRLHSENAAVWLPGCCVTRQLCITRNSDSSSPTL